MDPREVYRYQGRQTRRDVFEMQVGGLWSLRHEESQKSRMSTGSSHQRARGASRKGRVEEMLQLQCTRGTKRGLQPYDLSMHGGILHGLRREVEGM